MEALIAGILAKLAGMGMAAKAGLGLTVAAASVAGAGAAGVLPTPAQDAVATVVPSATPFTFGTTVSADATGADGTVGVDGKVVSDAAKLLGVEGDLDVEVEADEADNAGVGASTSGATGLDRANETPAAGHVPTELPAAATGAGAQGGLDTANGTPAAGHVPTELPAAGAGAQVGIDTANGTPAAGRIPAHVPGRR